MNEIPRVAAVGDTVKVFSPGHRKDRCVGVVVYVRGTVGVEIDGHNYGFVDDELKKVA